MTVIDKSVFSGLTGADPAVINQALQILNDPRLTLAEPLRQALAQREIVVRWPKDEDAIKPSDHAIFIDPKTISGVTTPGQIVLKPPYLQSDGPLRSCCEISSCRVLACSNKSMNRQVTERLRGHGHIVRIETSGV